MIGFVDRLMFFSLRLVWVRFSSPPLINELYRYGHNVGFHRSGWGWNYIGFFDLIGPTKLRAMYTAGSYSYYVSFGSYFLSGMKHRFVWPRWHRRVLTLPWVWGVVTVQKTFLSTPSLTDDIPPLLALAVLTCRILLYDSSRRTA